MTSAIRARIEDATEDFDGAERLARFGGTLGLGVIGLGIIILFFGWNGAASFDRVQSQFPYLISGGILGLSVVIVGAALLVIENQRKDRAAMQSSIGELKEAIEKLASSSGSAVPAGATRAAGPRGGDLVAAGEHDYVSLDSKLAQGRDDLTVMTRAEADAAGLVPSRIDFPEDREPADAIARKKRPRPAPPEVDTQAPADDTAFAPGEQVQRRGPRPSGTDRVPDADARPRRSRPMQTGDAPRKRRTRPQPES